MKHLLTEPTFVPNAADGMSCLPACIHMVLSTKKGISIPSFEEMNSIIGRKEGEYSFDYAILLYVMRQGFEMQYIQKFDSKAFIEKGKEYLIEFYGEEVAKHLVEHVNIVEGQRQARKFISKDNTNIEYRVPNTNEIKNFLDRGFYIMPVVNQRVLKGKEGYAAHSIVIYGYDDEGIFFENPGPPPEKQAYTTWDTFEKAWASPNADACNIIALKAT